MKKAIMPYVLRGISSDALRDTKRLINASKRQVRRGPPTLNIFIKADDPYSYLLVQALGDFQLRFNVKLKFHVFQDIDPEMYPRFEMWRSYSKHDAHYLATLYDFRFPNKEELPVHDEWSTETLSLALAQIEQEPDFLPKANQLLEQFWFKGKVAPSNKLDHLANNEKLEKNQRFLKQKGHYLGAMIDFEGEWYWGIDRLDHLEKRLIDLQLANDPDERVRFNRTYDGFCQSPVPIGEHANRDKPLVLYWSARSPYSYIGLEQAVSLASHYNIPLEIKPVLPMMMRGMNVPDTKKIYIFLDTKREANKLGLPYGFVADPLGAAVERCYSLVEYARSENKLQDFLLSFARGVNTQGIRAETDRGMRKIITRCGLDWQIAKTKLNDQNWRSWVTENLDEMFELGCWGVPTICYENTHFWGQDRFGLIEGHIRENLCLN